MTSWLEVAANATMTLSIVLAARNRVSTWPIGIVGCVLFGWLFWEARLLADVALQVFFVATSFVGWRRWNGGTALAPLPVRAVSVPLMLGALAAGAAVAVAYGAMLHAYTSAVAPFVDSAVLAFSVVAQLLLMQRRVETWWFWLLVDAIAVPLYAWRGLHLTALLYAAYFVNAALALVHWRRLRLAAA